MKLVLKKTMFLEINIECILSTFIVDPVVPNISSICRLPISCKKFYVLLCKKIFKIYHSYFTSLTLLFIKSCPYFVTLQQYTGVRGLFAGYKSHLAHIKEMVCIIIC